VKEQQCAASSLSMAALGSAPRTATEPADGGGGSAQLGRPTGRWRVQAGLQRFGTGDRSAARERHREILRRHGREAAAGPIHWEMADAILRRGRGPRPGCRQGPAPRR
jgi:hypothetical protein